MDLFEAAHGWDLQKGFPLQNLSHISYSDETWQSYTIPEEDPTNIKVTR